MFGVAEDHDSNPINIALSGLRRRGAKFVSANPIRTGYSAIADAARLPGRWGRRPGRFDPPAGADPRSLPRVYIPAAAILTEQNLPCAAKFGVPN
jgi:hypothetical protein